MILLALLIACRRPAAPPTSIDMPRAPGDAAPAPLVREALVGPTVWVGAGLEVRLPDGYRGEAGAVKERLIVRIVHEGTRGELAIEALAPDDLVVAPLGCVPLYEGERRWRELPALGPSQILTCVRDDPSAPIETRWVVREPSRTLVLTALLPPGRAFEARQALERVLGGVTRLSINAGGE